MTDEEREMLRNEIVAIARAQLVEGSTVQYWKFWRQDRGESGPVLYIGKTRRLVHIKGVRVVDRRWTYIPATDPKKVGNVHELRLEGVFGDVRAAFQSGMATLLNQ